MRAVFANKWGMLVDSICFQFEICRGDSVSRPKIYAIESEGDITAVSAVSVYLTYARQVSPVHRCLADYALRRVGMVLE